MASRRSRRPSELQQWLENPPPNLHPDLLAAIEAAAASGPLAPPLAPVSVSPPASPRHATSAKALPARHAVASPRGAGLLVPPGAASPGARRWSDAGARRWSDIGASAAAAARAVGGRRWSEAAHGAGATLTSAAAAAARGRRASETGATLAWTGRGRSPEAPASGLRRRVTACARVAGLSIGGVAPQRGAAEASDGSPRPLRQFEALALWRWLGEAGRGDQYDDFEDALMRMTTDLFGGAPAEEDEGEDEDAQAEPPVERRTSQQIDDELGAAIVDMLEAQAAGYGESDDAPPALPGAVPEIVEDLAAPPAEPAEQASYGDLVLLEQERKDQLDERMSRIPKVPASVTDTTKGIDGRISYVKAKIQALNELQHEFLSGRTKELVPSRPSTGAHRLGA